MSEDAATPSLEGGNRVEPSAAAEASRHTEPSGRSDPSRHPNEQPRSEPPALTEPPAEPQHVELGRRNGRLLLAAIAGYAVVLSLLMIAKGISVTPDVVVVAFGLAALLLGRGRLFLRDWIPFLALFLAYELMRGYADKFGQAIHVTDVIFAERLVGLGTLPTTIVQSLHHGPETAADPLATLSVVFYFLHFPLPLAVGFLLWIHRRPVYYDFVAALILVSMAGFVTYLVFPAAPPWWAEKYGFVSGILHLRDVGFESLAKTFGFGGNYVYTYSLYSISSNDVAAFPSLHAGYPFLAFLFARRAFGRAGWLMLVYTACVWFAIVYLGEHWVVDIIGGVAYAVAAYLVVTNAPGWYRRFVERAEDAELEAGLEAENAGQAGALAGLGLRIRWAVVAQGVFLVVIGGIVAYGMNRLGWLGGSSGGLYLVPWLSILGGLTRAAAGVLAR